MPSWSIHLAIAKKVNTELKLNNDLFYFGNLIPDINKKERYKAHYYNKNMPFDKCPKEEMIDISDFIKDYKNCLSNPLILGYYAHLLTDNFYNNIVYSKCWICDEKNNIVGIKLKNNKIIKIDIDDKKHKKKNYKHKDFELYGKYLFNNKKLIIPTNKKEIIKNIKFLNMQFLTIKDVSNKIDYLNTDFEDFNKLTMQEKMLKHKYKLFTKNDLDKIFEDCIKHVIKEIKKISNI